MNPVHQRHANQRTIACPVFWRNVGNPLANVLAAYPWALLAVGIPLLLISRLHLGVWYPAPVRAVDAAGRFAIGWQLALGWTLAETMFWAGCMLFGPAMAWWIFSWFATRLGVTGSWGWYVRSLVGFAGTAAVWLIVSRIAT